MLFFVLVGITLCPFAFILMRKREPVALIVFSFGCLVTIDVLWLFGAVGWSTVCDCSIS